MENKLSICPRCKLEQSCPGEKSNLCLNCIERQDNYNSDWWSIFFLLSFIGITIYLIITTGWLSLPFITMAFLPLCLPKKKYYNYLTKRIKKKPLYFIQYPEKFLFLVFLYSSLAIVPTIYYNFYPQEKVKRETQTEFNRCIDAYEKTHDVSVFQNYINRNKDSIKTIIHFLIEKQDSYLIHQYGRIKSIADSSICNSSQLSINEHYRITDRFITLYKQNSGYVTNAEDVNNSLYSLFSGLQPIEFSKVVEKKKSIVYIVENHKLVGLYYENGSMTPIGQAYQYFYSVYVIDLNKTKTIAVKEFLGGLPPERATKYGNSSTFGKFGDKPDMEAIKDWYLNLPLK